MLSRCFVPDCCCERTMCYCGVLCMDNVWFAYVGNLVRGLCVSCSLLPCVWHALRTKQFGWGACTLCARSFPVCGKCCACGSHKTIWWGARAPRRHGLVSAWFLGMGLCAPCHSCAAGSCGSCALGFLVVQFL